MKIVYHKEFANGTIVCAAKLDSFNMNYLSQFGFEHDPEKGLIKKQAESFMARRLVEQVIGISFNSILKEGKKPILKGDNREVSISHSGGLVAFIIGKTKVGIDIEEKWQKVGVIKHKFVNSKEASFISELEMKKAVSIIWGAKEALFKIYSKGAVSYLNDLFIDSFENEEEGLLSARVQKEEEIECRGAYGWVENQRFVWLEEIKE